MTSSSGALRPASVDGLSEYCELVTTEVMPVAGVPSYDSLLAMPISSSPVRVSYTRIDASVKETTKFSPFCENGLMQVGEGCVARSIVCMSM